MLPTERWAAVAGTGDVDHVQIVFFDDPVQMDVDEVLPGRRPPVAEEHVLDVLWFKRSAKEGVVVEVYLADGEIIGGTPIGVDLAKEVG